MKIGCVIMASGAAKRFGTNKLLASLGGKPLVSYAFHNLPQGLARTVVVTRDETVAAMARTEGFEPLLHSLPQVSDTIRLGIEAMLDMDGCLFCMGDQPGCSPATQEKLLQTFETNPEGIIRASYQGQPGAPVLFSKAYFTELLALTGEQAGSVVIRNHAGHVRYVEAASAQELMDVDTPQQLAFFEHHLGK